MLKLLGPATSITLCAAAFMLAVDATRDYGTANAISIGAAAMALAAMSQCLVLAARFRILEPVFGGLDRVYRMHKYLGIMALAMMILHNIVEPDFEDWVEETGLGDLAEDIGEVAFAALVALILLSWVKRIPRIHWEIPYPLWHFFHRFTGAFFALVAFHQLLIDKPFAASEPLSIYLNTLCVIGICCYLFTEFAKKSWRRSFYTVASMERKSGALEIALDPVGRPLLWKPGQFAFLAAASPLAEFHPFTLTAPPGPDGSVRFAIKALGDWTSQLPLVLKPGATVQVEGPYGRFNFRKFDLGKFFRRKEKQRQVWVAGGIGITPFLAWAQSLTGDENISVYLFYSTVNAEEAFGLDVLEEAKARLQNFSFHVVFSQREGRSGVNRLLANAPFDVKGADFFFCGPPNMRKAILKGLNVKGMRPGSVNFELFEFR
ncbi:putative ferric reductase [Nitrosospira multiformis]|uniref:Putative ferric reductase n=1 Tax=Nitrosospira multiformis TaxID=1231 RepID=A0A2T5IGR2_9PROT|nr:ferredoxin reductase family protein [Nitrosospira multiformis]PTQ83024.1 putative ferric reductase [Nitrosospira multiformis]